MTSKSELAAHLIELGLAGKGAGHDREINVKVAEKAARGRPYQVLGVNEVTNYTPEEILAMVAGETGCSRDFLLREGPGYIDPDRTLAGIEALVSSLQEVGKTGGKVLFATGHPGALLSLYQGLAKRARDLGAKALMLAAGEVVKEYRSEHGTLLTDIIDYAGDVAVQALLGQSLNHSHETGLMEAAIARAKATNQQIELVISDHGFAGYAAASGFKTVAFMDTNDPAMAVAKHLGYPLTLIPMDDNQPNYITVKLLEIIDFYLASGG